MTLKELATLHHMTLAEYVALESRQRSVANEAKAAAFLRGIDTTIAKGKARTACRIAHFTAAIR